MAAPGIGAVLKSFALAIVLYAAVATVLPAPLDVFVVRKLGVPGHEELAMGAIASGGVRVLNDNVLAMLDISPEAIAAAVKWDWTTFRDYMNTVDRLPKAINYACNIGHSALRMYAMGKRAFTEKATEDEMVRMADLVKMLRSIG